MLLEGWNESVHPSFETAAQESRPPQDEVSWQFDYDDSTSSERALRRIELIDLDAGGAFELPLRQLRRQLRIEGALARLAEQIGTDDDPAAGVPALADLLDEQRADRAFALGGRQRGTVARR